MLTFQTFCDVSEDVFWLLKPRRRGVRVCVRVFLGGVCFDMSYGLRAAGYVLSCVYVSVCLCVCVVGYVL